MSERRSIPLPVPDQHGHWPILTAAWPISEVAWDQMLKILEIMKPALVIPELTDRAPEQADPGGEGEDGAG